MGKKSLADLTGGCAGCNLMIAGPDTSTGVAQVFCFAEKGGSWVKPRPIGQKDKECQIEKKYEKKLLREQKSAEPRPENVDRRKEPRIETSKKQTDNQILSMHYG